MTIITHSKDQDGHCSGAICKLKYPDAKLIGWDYTDEIPDFKQFVGDDVIMIDITFPIPTLLELGRISRLTVIDHHISFKKKIDDLDSINFTYIYEDGIAACEIGWKCLFPNTPIPYAVTLISRYDTWRQSEGDWKNETLPFKYYMYGQCNTAETFPINLFKADKYDIELCLMDGKNIMKYQETLDEAVTKSYAFEKMAFGLRALVLNASFFSSDILKTKYDPLKHDIMLAFVYTGTQWSVSLRSAKPEFDVSVIAKERGGGGHLAAAGFEVDNFSNIFK